MTRWIAGAVFLAALYFLLSHSAWPHDIYTNWTNRQGVNCCNNQDCAPLSEYHERTTAIGVEVLVEGAWCPIRAEHYLQQGNAPDWSTAHVCVRKQYILHSVSPCDRLLCYQPKPLF